MYARKQKCVKIVVFQNKILTFISQFLFLSVPNKFFIFMDNDKILILFKLLYDEFVFV